MSAASFEPLAEPLADTPHAGSTGIAASDRWRLPDGIDEWLPADARRLEALRARFLALGSAFGFEPVVPPLIEYLDSLLTGTGEVMDLQTFKLVDQRDGRTLGVRADMTPQVARIDAHALRRAGVNRLMYTGTVLRARSDAIGGSRNPQQLGAELFGHVGPDADIEIVRLMLETVLLSGAPPDALVLSLGHVGLYANLLAEAKLPPAARERLFEAMTRASVPDLRDIAREASAGAGSDDGSLPSRSAVALDALTRLPTLRGDRSVLERARHELDAAIGTDALTSLDAVLDALAESHPQVGVHIDLADLRGYRYHTGLLFAVHDRTGRALARGGRYDAIGEAFGSRRPATGFSGELAALAAIGPGDVSSVPGGGAILLRAADRTGAWQAVMRLRARGETVIDALPGEPPDARADRALIHRDGRWTVVPLDTVRHDTD